MTGRAVTAADIAARASAEVFGRPLVANNFRAVVVEAIVAAAVGDDWVWCSGDWAGCDFRRGDGLRLEVKQSARIQTWTNAPLSKPIFDIAPRKGQYDGARWLAAPGRNADAYLFAHHAVEDRAVADHRDPRQWTFYVLAASRLPPVQKTIALTRIIALGASRADFDGLRTLLGAQKADAG